MKKIIPLYCLCFILNNAFAQKESYQWFFGNGVGLDFNVSPPQPSSGWIIGATEGCSIYNDENGTTLFYTNGAGVMNSKHQLMKNGAGLHGDLSSTDNTVIIPLPGKQNIFYLFTIGAAGQGYGLNYSIIDMEKDSGFGEVVQKNIIVVGETFEKLAAVRHCNNVDVWITVKINETDEYNSYLITVAGLNPTPVVSHTGLVINAEFFSNNSIGTLKFSVDGSRLVAVHAFQNDLVELMSFNNFTGEITNPIVFKPNPPHPSTHAGVYGAEFSPNNNLLYISSTNSLSEPCLLYQFDITSGNAAAILASKQIIAQSIPWNAGALQIGPDKKIYMAMYNDTSISVIEQPDLYGPACNFNYNKIYMGSLNNRPVQYGLPRFIQSLLDTTNIQYTFSRSGNCGNPDVQFNMNKTTGLDSVSWDFGDGLQSKLFNPMHHYNLPGYYTVTLTYYKPSCTGNFNTIQRLIWVAPQNFLGNDTAVCLFKDFSLGINVIGGSYLWNTAESFSTIKVNTDGLYWQEIKQAGCTVRDSILLTLNPTPVVNIGKDTSVCINNPITLDAGNMATSYLWNTGATTKTITINSSGIYYVTLMIANCQASDTVFIDLGDCEFYIPSAFTPNKDGLNDSFGVIREFKFSEFSFNVYNRYGQIIFSAKTPYEKWDGSFKNNPVQAGNYLWKLEFKNQKGGKKFFKGQVLLIR